MTYILGISGGFHEGNLDTSAVLLRNGKVIAGVEEERLSRIKHAAGTFPKRSVLFCLDYAGITIQDVDYLVFHMNTYENIEDNIINYMNFHFGHCPEVRCVDHHTAHAACTYYLSGFNEAKIITIDFSGDKICTTLNYGKGNKITPIKRYNTPNSLGIYYSILTQYLGFKILSHEYKVMGLSAYGKSNSELEEIFNKILQIKDTEYIFDTNFFKERKSLQQNLFSDKLVELLGTNRKSFDPISQKEMDIAYVTQRQFEKACLALLKEISREYDTKNLCLAGGSSLNCVMNSVLLDTEYVENIYIPHCAGDSGTSLGAAFIVANDLGFKIEPVKTPFLGPEFTNEQIKKDLDTLKLSYQYFEEDELLDHISSEIIKGKIIGWVQGRAEFGARALGNRSILANPADPQMKDKINKYIKFRETFRPFAPSVALEDAHKYFNNVYPAPYMNLTFEVTTDKLPAITHVDGSARVQTVSRKENELYYKLIQKMGEKTGIAMVLNTSLNIMGQPMVCSPKEALTVFGATGMDVIVLNNYVLTKSKRN